MHKLMQNQNSDYSLNTRSKGFLNTNQLIQSVDVANLNISNNKSADNTIGKKYRLPHINKRWDDSEAYFDLSRIQQFNKGKNKNEFLSLQLSIN